MIPREILLRLGTAGAPSFVIALETKLGTLLLDYESYTDARAYFLSAISSDCSGCALIHLDSDVNIAAVEVYTKLLAGDAAVDRILKRTAERN